MEGGLRFKIVSVRQEVWTKATKKNEPRRTQVLQNSRARALVLATGLSNRLCESALDLPADQSQVMAAETRRC